VNRQSLRLLSTHDLVYYRLQLNWNIKVNKILNYWVLSLNLFRFRETYFTAYLQFVANKGVISLFLGGFRVSVDISESILHVFESLSWFCARISESFLKPHTHFRVSLNILESLSHVFQILSRFRGRISESVSIFQNLFRTYLRFSFDFASVSRSLSRFWKRFSDVQKQNHFRVSLDSFVDQWFTKTKHVCINDLRI